MRFSVEHNLQIEVGGIDFLLLFQTAIKQFDANYQDIIRLRFFEEKSIKEIAEELGISVANTKVRVMRAKKVLAELLKNNEFEDN